MLPTAPVQVTMDPTRLTEWLKQPQRVLWGFVIVVALMLWGPNWFINGLRVEEFIDEYRGFIGVAFLFFLVAALTNTLHLLGQHALKKWQGRKLEEEAERRNVLRRWEAFVASIPVVPSAVRARFVLLRSFTRHGDRPSLTRDVPHP